MENFDAEEAARMAARDAEIGIDIDRIKADITATAKRHGFEDLTFAVSWPELAMDSEPSVSCKGCLFG